MQREASEWRDGHGLADPEPIADERPWRLLAWSATTPEELDHEGQRLASYLEVNQHRDLAGIAAELFVRQPRLPHRRMIVCRDHEDALRALRNDADRIESLVEERVGRRVAFLLPGQGSQYVNMGKELYENEPPFRGDVTYCCQHLQPYLKLDLRDLLYPIENKAEEAAELLGQTRFTQPAMFTIQYALARQWMRWGIRPAALIGHSLGEFAAACIAGVFSLEDGLKLVAVRGKMTQQVAGGAMVSILLSEAELTPILEQIGGVEISAINTPSSCVVSGSKHKIERLEREMAGREVMTRRLRVTAAGHSAAVDPILEDFGKVVHAVQLHPPTMPYLSNLTGQWVDGAEITEPDYWVRHMRCPVRFSDGATKLLKDEELILLEVGPGKTLGTLLSQHAARPPRLTVISSLPGAKEPQADMQCMLAGLGRLWMEGAGLHMYP